MSQNYVNDRMESIERLTREVSTLAREIAAGPGWVLSDLASKVDRATSFIRTSKADLERYGRLLPPSARFKLRSFFVAEVPMEHLLFNGKPLFAHGDERCFGRFEFFDERWNLIGEVQL